jgi:hypothetical protein
MKVLLRTACGCERELNFDAFPGGRISVPMLGTSSSQREIGLKEPVMMTRTFLYFGAIDGGDTSERSIRVYREELLGEPQK